MKPHLERIYICIERPVGKIFRRNAISTKRLNELYLSSIFSYKSELVSLPVHSPPASLLENVNVSFSSFPMMLITSCTLILHTHGPQVPNWVVWCILNEIRGWNCKNVCVNDFDSSMLQVYCVWRKQVKVPLWSKWTYHLFTT